MTTGGFITLLVLLTIGALVFIQIAGMPGRNARARNHPSADAIALLGWLGLFFGGVPWLVAMVWARLDPVQVQITPKKPEPEPATPESADEDEE
jgi:hypothetical protein